MRAIVNYDPSAPTVDWNSPASDRWLRGSVPLQVGGRDDLSGVDHFALTLGPGTVVSSADGTATLDTTGLPDGPRALTATADRSSREPLRGRNAHGQDRQQRAARLARRAGTGDPRLGLAGACGERRRQRERRRAGALRAATCDGRRLAAAGSRRRRAVPRRVARPSVGDGAYEVRAVAADAVGNEASAPATAIVIDRTAPAASLDSLAASVSGTLTLAATASDPGSGVARVEFQVARAGSDAWEPITSLDAPPWKARFATTDLSDGVYALRVLVRDRAGNELASVVRTTTVRNARREPRARCHRDHRRRRQEGRAAAGPGTAAPRRGRTHGRRARKGVGRVARARHADPAGLPPAQARPARPCHHPEERDLPRVAAAALLGTRAHRVRR